jgi:hypothetical protein
MLPLVSFAYPLIFQRHAVTGRPKAFFRKSPRSVLDQRFKGLSRDEGIDEPTIKRTRGTFK